MLAKALAGRGDGRLRLAAAALLCAACGGATPGGGGGEAAVAIAAASFPAHQRLAVPARLRLAVRNDGARDLPEVVVSIDSFSTAGAGRPTPVWLVDRAPGVPAGAGTSADQTWALGRLAPGATASFTWQVTPVRAGTYRVAYGVTAGTATRLAAGAFAVTVSGAPADPRVDPVTGRVVRYRGRRGRMMR